MYAAAPVSAEIQFIALEVHPWRGSQGHRHPLTIPMKIVSSEGHSKILFTRRPLHVVYSEIIYKGIGNEPTFHALERAIRTCTRTHNQQMYACTQIGQLSL